MSDTEAEAEEGMSPAHFIAGEAVLAEDCPVWVNGINSNPGCECQIIEVEVMQELSQTDEDMEDSEIEEVSEPDAEQTQKRGSCSSIQETGRRKVPAASEEHNRKERIRRKELKNAVDELKKQLTRPTKKSSTISVLKAAQDEIKDLTIIKSTDEKRLEELRKKHEHLQWMLDTIKAGLKLGSTNISHYSQGSTSATPTSRPSPTSGAPVSPYPVVGRPLPISRAPVAPYPVVQGIPHGGGMALLVGQGGISHNPLMVSPSLPLPPALINLPCPLPPSMIAAYKDHTQLPPPMVPAYSSHTHHHHIAQPSLPPLTSVRRARLPDVSPRPCAPPSSVTFPAREPYTISAPPLPITFVPPPPQGVAISAPPPGFMSRAPAVPRFSLCPPRSGVFSSIDSWTTDPTNQRPYFPVTVFSQPPPAPSVLTTSPPCPPLSSSSSSSSSSSMHQTPRSTTRTAPLHQTPQPTRGLDCFTPHQPPRPTLSNPPVPSSGGLSFSPPCGHRRAPVRRTRSDGGVAEVITHRSLSSNHSFTSLPWSRATGKSHRGNNSPGNPPLPPPPLMAGESHGGSSPARNAPPPPLTAGESYDRSSPARNAPPPPLTAGECYGGSSPARNAPPPPLMARECYGGSSPARNAPPPLSRVEESHTPARKPPPLTSSSDEEIEVLDYGREKHARRRYCSSDSDNDSGGSCLSDPGVHKRKRTKVTRGNANNDSSTGRKSRGRKSRGKNHTSSGNNVASGGHQQTHTRLPLPQWQDAGATGEGGASGRSLVMMSSNYHVSTTGANQSEVELNQRGTDRRVLPACPLVPPLKTSCKATPSTEGANLVSMSPASMASELVWKNDSDEIIKRFMNHFQNNFPEMNIDFIAGNTKHNPSITQNTACPVVQ